MIVIVRNYFLARAVGPERPDRRASGSASSRSTTIRAAAAARRRDVRARLLDAGVAFLRADDGRPAACSATPSPVPFVAERAEHGGRRPWSFRNAGVDAAGAVDIFYSMGRWDLRPDDALVMRGHDPDRALHQRDAVEPRTCRRSSTAPAQRR